MVSSSLCTWALPYRLPPFASSPGPAWLHHCLGIVSPPLGCCVPWLCCAPEGVVSVNGDPSFEVRLSWWHGPWEAWTLLWGVRLLWCAPGRMWPFQKIAVLLGIDVRMLSLLLSLALVFISIPEPSLGKTLVSNIMWLLSLPSASASAFSRQAFTAHVPNPTTLRAPCFLGWCPLAPSMA